MRFEHKAGEKVFVDYAGQTMSYYCKHTGHEFKAQVFVGAGCSHYTYAEATADQRPAGCTRMRRCLISSGRYQRRWYVTT